MSHVPGPYHVVQPGTEANRSEFIEIEDGFGRTATVYGEVNDPETQATATLFAAVPDLLEALEELLFACEGVGGGHNSEGVLNRRTNARAKAREVIKKAKP